MSLHIAYTNPHPPGIQCIVTLSPKAPEEYTFVNPDHGIIARYSAKKAVAIAWGEVVHHLRWALDRSPKMRADIREMIEAFDERDAAEERAP